MMTNFQNEDEVVNVLPLINHPIRVDIIKILFYESASFTDLLRYLSIESTSKLSFHLNKLEKLIEKDENGNYKLNFLGKKTFTLITAFEEDKLTESQTKTKNSELVTISVSKTSLHTLQRSIQEKISSKTKSISEQFYDSITQFYVYLKNINPSSLIIYFPLSSLVILMSFIPYIRSLPLNQDFSINYLLIYFVIIYFPLIVLTIFIWKRNYPKNYSLQGSYLVLFLTIFLVKIYKLDTINQNETIPISLGIKLLSYLTTNPNEVFLQTILLTLVPYPLFIYLINRYSRPKLRFTEDIRGIELPKIIMKFGEKKIWILEIIILIGAVIISNNPTNYGALGSIVPPLRELFPFSLIIIVDSALFYRILTNTTISKKRKKFLYLIIIFWYPSLLIVILLYNLTVIGNIVLTLVFQIIVETLLILSIMTLLLDYLLKGKKLNQNIYTR